MNIRFRTTAWFVIVIISGILAAPVWAQAPKPKPGKPPAAKAVPKPAAEKPPVAEPTSDDPAVVAILATKPSTPIECARAAAILADLGRADLAKSFIKKVLDAHLDQQQLADLSAQLGETAFFDLSSRADLQPEGKQLADAVTAVVTANRQDPARIAALIGQLRDASPEKRLEGSP